MNRLFRIATRTLCLGLLAALSLGLVVTAKGIHPEVLVASKEHSEEIQLAQVPESPPDPLQFAQVEPATRLDAPATVRSVGRSGLRRTIAPPVRTTAPQSPTGEEGEPARELPQLPPLPRSQVDYSLDNENAAPEAEILKSPTHMPSPEDFEVALKDPAGPASTTSAATGSATENPFSSPTPDETPAAKSTVKQPSKSTSADGRQPDATGLASRLDSLQEQLQKLTLEQEHQRLSQQALLGPAQLLQEQKLQGKLDNIEAALLELKAKPDRLAKSESYIQRIPQKHPASGIGGAPLVREEQPGVDGEKRFSIESHQGGLRELLDMLTQKANLNLVLTINVEGDVEMSLQNATAEEALKAIENTTGYIVEKAGKKVYVRPPVPMKHQRELYLPPIVKEPVSAPSAP